MKTFSVTSQYNEFVTHPPLKRDPKPHHWTTTQFVGCGYTAQTGIGEFKIRYSGGKEQLFKGDLSALTAMRDELNWLINAIEKDNPHV